MSLDELIQHILLLSPEEKDRISSILSQERHRITDDHFFPSFLSKVPEWKEIERRAKELIHEEKTCLIDFDDHIQSITA